MKIRPSTTQDHKEMARILLEAFILYPVFMAFLPEMKYRGRFLRELFIANVRVFEEINGSYVAVNNNDEIVGVMLVKDDQHPEPSIWDYLKHSRLRMLRPSNLRSLRDFFKTIDEMDGEMINDDEKSWYVDSLAIDPTHQRHGIGSELLQELEQIVKSGRIILSTNSESNAKFYRKSGYQLVNYSDKNPQFETWQFKKIIF